MELSPVSAPISPVQSSPIVQPQASPEPPETEPEVTEGQANGKANGVVRKLNEGSHFNAVADVRLRISHFDNPDLERIDPALLPDPEDVRGKAYEKFLAQYQDLYAAGLPLTEPEEPAAQAPEEPAAEEPEVPQEPVIEAPPLEPELVVPQEPTTVAPPESEPLAVVEDTGLQAPVDESEGVLAALVELLNIQALEQEPETLDIVI